MSARRRTRSRPRISLPRFGAEKPGTGRRCNQCGDFIDPIDWCSGCLKEEKPCGRPHKRLYKRADAEYCNDACRSERRNSYIRDCL